MSKPQLTVLLPCVALLVFSAGCKSNRSQPSAPAAPPPPPANAWAIVNGHAITQEDVDKAYRRTSNPGQSLSDEETMTAKLGLLNDMIVQEVLIARASALKIEVPQSELDAAYKDAEKNIADKAFQDELKQRGLTTEDMREGLRRELLMQRVVTQEVGTVTVTDQQVTDFFNANRAQFNVPEEAYHLAQIVVTPVRDPQVGNATGDDATTPQAAAAKVQMLMERLKAGANFRDLAVGYSEDPQSAARGGDLGLVPISRLKQAPPQLRDAVLNKAPGTVNVASAGGAHTLVLVVSHEAAGQRDLSMPGVKEQITQTLQARREALLRAAYLTAIRSDAKVENLIARKLVDSKGAVK